MASTVSLEIPREVVHATRMSPQELRCELAVGGQEVLHARELQQAAFG